MNINPEETRHNIYFISDQVAAINKRVGVLGKQLDTIEESLGVLRKRLDTIEENYKEQCKITEKCQKKNRKFLSRIYRRQKKLFEKAEATENKDELKQDIEQLAASIKDLEKTTENIIATGATKSEITSAIGNLQVTQQITQQATVPQVGSTWYYF